MGIITDILKDIPLSTVLRERLIDQERRMSELESENRILKLENQNLKLTNDQQNKKIQAYEKLSHDTSLNEIEVKILLCLSKKDKMDEIQISQLLNIGKEVAIFHLIELTTKNMITVNPFIFNYSLDQKGRRYLIENKLIS